MPTTFETPEETIRKPEPPGMDKGAPIATIDSSRFRLEYPKLRVPMIVEAYGRPIGKWVPFAIVDPDAR